MLYWFSLLFDFLKIGVLLPENTTYMRIFSTTTSKLVDHTSLIHFWNARVQYLHVWD